MSAPIHRDDLRPYCPTLCGTRKYPAERLRCLRYVRAAYRRLSTSSFNQVSERMGALLGHAIAERFMIQGRRSNSWRARSGTAQMLAPAVRSVRLLSEPSSLSRTVPAKCIERRYRLSQLRTWNPSDRQNTFSLTVSSLPHNLRSFSDYEKILRPASMAMRILASG